MDNKETKNEEIRYEPIKEGEEHFLPEDELGRFPFSVLWQDEMEQSLLKFVPIVNMVLLLIIVIVYVVKH